MHIDDKSCLILQVLFYIINFIKISVKNVLTLVRINVIIWVK